MNVSLTSVAAGVATVAPARGSPRHARRTRRVLLICRSLAAAVALLAIHLTVTEFHHVYFSRLHLPDLGPFTRFEFPTIGRVYDAGGRPLIELAHEYREIVRYEDIPPIVRDAILAAEDKRFFSHNGIDYFSLPRALGKARIGMLAGRLVRGGRHDEANGVALFPQGGSTITQQLVRGVFLRPVTAQEKSHQLRQAGLAAGLLSPVLGARSVNMLARKREEIRLSLWLEDEMRERFGSKRRAKEEILARYASFVYMGNGQYGFARAAEYYFGRRLSTFTAEDADKAAVLAGIAKSPRDYAPSARNTERVIRRRNQTLTLMGTNGFIARAAAAEFKGRALQVVRRDTRPIHQASAVVEHVLEELTSRHADLSVEDLLQGRLQVYATADARVQHIVNEALEHGLERYERRHPKARGMIQGSVVVLQNRDGRILAETGGRQVFNGRSTSYSDYNRVTRSLRQPGSAMKAIVYLAAFQHGGFTLETMVPDEPISVPDGTGRPPKWISNYDGRFKGLIPIRQALAESRNAVAMWITGQIGIDSVLRISRSLGVRTPLQRYATTALGASEMNLLELANAYRTMASGLVAEPYLIRAIRRDSGEVVAATRPGSSRIRVDAAALSLIQEGLRGVVRLPNGTAHALAARGFPIAVMGKTGTTNDFRDAIFVGSTYGPTGITAAVRIGFDDNRSLGSSETGGRLALPVFQELMVGVYRDKLVGAAPAFPAGMEARIAAALPLPTAPPVAPPVAVVRVPIGR
ncbi:MAG TPA: transglycosylase domain-containing protein [Vicinamibacterales bacterium]|nr:transglycosylase domain-containing protein [Vicinamibacterales bacterium]